MLTWDGVEIVVGVYEYPNWDRDITETVPYFQQSSFVKLFLWKSRINKSLRVLINNIKIINNCKFSLIIILKSNKFTNFSQTCDKTKSLHKLLITIHDVHW